ncbi:LuxR C-terminal-related transcriptional regulator [Streptomyces sp. NPDC005820]|uniref:LuxR C-terminal-related transcriptional regulator n=1 Tax=Streptomyces sp. NPDC005820 TaxID=3157069 RepID=UPI003401EC85
MGLSPQLVDRLVTQVNMLSTELTGREIQVVRLMAEGNSNRSIAQSLYLGEATISQGWLQTTGRHRPPPPEAGRAPGDRERCY